MGTPLDYVKHHSMMSLARKESAHKERKVPLERIACPRMHSDGRNCIPRGQIQATPRCREEDTMLMQWDVLSLLIGGA